MRFVLSIGSCGSFNDTVCLRLPALAQDGYRLTCRGLARHGRTDNHYRANWSYDITETQHSTYASAASVL